MKIALLTLFSDGAYLKRIRELRGGRLSDPRFGSRMTGEGPIAEAIQRIFEVTRKRLGFKKEPALSTSSFRRPGESELSLFT